MASALSRHNLRPPLPCAGAESTTVRRFGFCRTVHRRLSAPRPYARSWDSTLSNCPLASGGAYHRRLEAELDSHRQTLSDQADELRSRSERIEHNVKMNRPGFRSGQCSLGWKARRSAVFRPARSQDILLHLANLLEIEEVLLKLFEFAGRSRGFLSSQLLSARPNFALPGLESAMEHMAPPDWQEAVSVGSYA